MNSRSVMQNFKTDRPKPQHLSQSNSRADNLSDREQRVNNNTSSIFDNSRAGAQSAASRPSKKVFANSIIIRREAEPRQKGKRMTGFQTTPEGTTMMAQMNYLDDIAAKYQELIDTETAIRRKTEQAQDSLARRKQAEKRANMEQMNRRH